MKHLTISSLIFFAGMTLFSLNNPTNIQAKSYTTVPKVFWDLENSFRIQRETITKDS
ncbi:hypothetical protein KTE19_12925 [Lentilactobacillus sp. IMAU92037]|uniref:hypothetical protein n=1 Tax=Lentilactobacillus dabitei TaxID=2831523 RepID=UPI001C2C3B75|nr:hypothetical protein [Lentilactobacillus dabitei]MBV0931576.1 hypothetical protein [Lentilactobacillus dabitei]